MTLIDLLKAVNLDALLPQVTHERLATIVISGMLLDSRHIASGDLFLAYPGQTADGRRFIRAAIERGAIAVLSDGDTVSVQWADNVPVISIPQLQLQVSQLASCYYGNPTGSLCVTGITGTNGKTSCLHFLAQSLCTLGRKVATIGTLGAGIFPDMSTTHMTTPDPVTTQRLCREFADQGVTDIIMEVSSHSLDQGRVSGISFDYAVFTHLSHDHLDYHGSMAAYAAAKEKLFHFSSLRAKIINGDCSTGQYIIDQLESLQSIYQYQCMHEGVASPYAYIAHTDYAGLTLTWPNLGSEFKVSAPLFGQFNSGNLAAVVTTLIAMGVSETQIPTAIATLKPVPGRMQMIPGKTTQPLCVVDYAHTPDALKNLLRAARDYLAASGQLICIFGCGGDRDASKRAMMGKVAEQCADQVVLTTDNPRSEDPQKIIHDIVEGIDNPQHYQVILDREDAIRHGFSIAHSGDVLVVAGKGHEDYQITAEGRCYFSDEQVLLRLLESASSI